MNEQLLDTIKELEIKKMPEEKSLEAANMGYTKKQLTHFIERHDLDIAKSWKKAEIVEPLTEWMKDVRTELLNSDADLLSFYNENALQADEPFNIYEADLSEDNLARVVKLMEHGLVFNVDGTLWIPEETAAAVSEEVETDTPASTEEVKTEEKVEEPKAQPKPAVNNWMRKKTLTPEELLEQKKQTRLNYLKKQAKKKRGKKRK